MKLDLRFFLSWIVSAIVMFSLFYLWHGVFLNDFIRIQFPITLFIIFAAFTYLIFSLAIYALYESVLMKKIKNFFLRGLITGAISGFIFFMIATVVNISLSKHLSMQHLFIDCIWQITEQILGTMFILLFKVLIHDAQTERV